MKMQRTSAAITLIVVSFGIAASASTAGEALPQGNAANGKGLYNSCMGCHSLDENEAGPRHRGVVGRVAASVPGYAYSAGLKQSGLTWTAANLDRWLTGPQKLVPGAKMFFSVSSAQNRADIIAYLTLQR